MQTVHARAARSIVNRTNLLNTSTYLSLNQVWGHNYFGQLGLGDNRRRIYPVNLNYFSERMVAAPNLAPRDGGGCLFLKPCFYDAGANFASSCITLWYRVFTVISASKGGKILTLRPHSSSDEYPSRIQENHRLKLQNPYYQLRDLYI